MQNRPRRKNAGKNMKALLSKDLGETGDEFYKTLYGGFDEKSDDDNFVSSDASSDVVDSDFDNSESEAEEKGEEIEKKKRKPTRKRINTSEMPFSSRNQFNINSGNTVIN